MPMFNILFDVSRYDNLIFKPFENHFVTNNKNVYIPPQKPLSCKYLLPDEYTDIISLNDLSILHVNCRSMHNFRNFNNVILYLKLFAQPFAIIAITETWLLDSNALQSYEINNYKLFNKNRENTSRGGGIALYIHASIIQYFDSAIIFNSIVIMNRLLSIFLTCHLAI